MKKEKARRLAKRITAFAAAVAMAATFTFPAEVGDGFFDGFGNAIVASAETGDFTVTGGTEGTDYSYADNVLTILTETPLTISGTTTTDRIEVASGVSANITLDGVDIDVSSKSNTAAFKIADNSTGNVTITLADGSENTLKSGRNCAGLQKNGSGEGIGKLTIKSESGTGKLTATGDSGGAGIGGGYNQSGSYITISGGTVTATGGTNGAGIGGGNYGSCSNIEISGGTVTATGGDTGAGIGGGNSGTGSSITISGGTVTATCGYFGAGIGGGFDGSGSDIIISGGTVAATGGSMGAGIGGGHSKSGSNITISGGTVTATGGPMGAGIGGGFCGSGSNITISGGTVTATGNEYGAGIGGGNRGASGSNITISGGTVTATGGPMGAGIGGGFCGSGSNITISGGTVTATGGPMGAGIGGGNVGNGSNIEITGGSVKAVAGTDANAIGGGSGNGAVTPTLADGAANVYLLTIENPDGKDVFIDGSTTPYKPSNHSAAGTGDTNLYAYLTGETHKVKIGDEETEYKFYTDKFLPVPKASDFTFTAPTAPIVYDNTAKEAAVMGISGTGTVTVKYYLVEGDTETLLTDDNKPVNAGTYKVKIDVEKGTSYAAATDLTADTWTFTITAGTLKASDFTFTAPTNPAYDGSVKTATVTAKDGITGIGEITVKYQKTGDTTATTEAPKTPGTYKVSIDVAAGDNYAAVTGLTADAWEFTITKATPIVPVPPASTAVEYGKTLADAGLTEGWTWEDGNSTVPQPANTYTAYKELTDDGNYDYSGLSVSGFTYDEDDHKLSYEVPVTVNPVTPTITVTASPSSAITGKATTVTLTSEVKNPNNDSLNDCPSPEFFYKIGNGPEQDITNGSFVIPADTPNGTTFTISARTPGTANYIAGTGTTTILVSNCTHPDVSDAWETDETYHWHECTDCGAELYKAEHSSNAPATETSPEVCKDCGYEMSPATGHIHKNHLTFVDKVEPADCTTDGTEAHYECDCGKLFADDQATTEVTLESLKIAAHHSYGTEWVSDNDDNHYHVCSVCGDKTDITDHSYDNGVITTPATEQTTGIKTYTCSECNHTKTEIVPKLNHTHSLATEYSSDATGHWYACSGCTEKVDFEAHTEDSGTVTTEPTETTEGIKTFKCTKCEYVIRTEPIAVLEHTHSLATYYSSDATGHWYACSGCTEKVDFEAHTEDSGTVTTEPTETTEGVKTFKCVKCEYVMRTETIPPITPEHTHEYSTEWKSDSTSHWHECACGEKADIAAHISDNGVVTLQPTETSEGIMTYSCTVCDYILRTETIPAIVPEHTHEYGTEWKSDSSTHWHECSCGEKTDIAQHISNGGIVTVQPTATSTGLRVYSCSICGYVLRTETIPATGYGGYPSYPTYPTYPFDSSIFNVVSFTDKLNVTAETTGNTVTLKWDKVEKADKYYVYQYKNGKYVKIKTTADTSVTLKGLKNGETYKFLVRYTINGRLSPTAYSSKFTVKVYYKPLPKATATKNSVKLTWEAVPDAKKYAIYKYVDGKAVKLAEVKGTSVRINKLSPDTEYSYIVSAYVDGEWTKMYKSDIVTVKTTAE